MSKPKNPYCLGPTSDTDAPFVGRDEAFVLVETELRAPERNAILLCGPRRIGKTSLLLQLQRRLPSPPFLAFYFDLQGRAHTPIARVLLDMAATLAAEVHMEPLDESLFDDQGAYFLGTFLPAFYRALPGDYRPVLLLDDLDVLDLVGEKQLPPQSCARALPPLLARMVLEEPRLGFVFSSSYRAAELSLDAQALLRTAREKTLELLDPEAADTLVRTAQRQGSLALAEGVPERVTALTAGHPYLVQLVCHQLFEDAWAEAEAIPHVTPADVEAAVERAQLTAEVLFEEILASLSPAERVLLAAIGAAAGPHGAVNDAQQQAALATLGVRILTRELELAPAALVARGLLIQDGTGLRFAVEMVRRYIAQRKPPARVKAEVGQIVPQASALYATAQELREKWRFAEAQECLERALRQNPNHLGARVLLGQILADQGQPEQARRELEEASLYDEEAARYPLLRALLSHGEELERQGAPERALLVYERALLLSPNEAVAQRRRQALLCERGDRAYAEGDMEGARQSYEQAGLTDKVNAILDRSKGVELRRLETEAQSCESIGDWDRAHALYARLSEGDPARFSEATARASTELVLRQRYAEAQEAMAAKEWDRALRSLGEVARLRPGYRDASELLARAADAHARQQRKASGVHEGTARGGEARAWPRWVVGAGLAGLLVAGGVGLSRYRGTTGPAGTPQTPVGEVTAKAGANIRPGPALPPLHLLAHANRPDVIELAQSAEALWQAGRSKEALEQARKAYRLDPQPAWYYDLGVLHDQIGECDDAAFFYRAASFGKAITSEDQPRVEARLGALEAECQFRRRQATTVDRHARAARYLNLKLCSLAQSILSGIATPAELTQVALCQGRPAPHPQPRQQPRAQQRLTQAAEPKTERTPPPGQAWLTVTVQPSAMVFVDGVKVGQTPVKDRLIGVGSHSVVLVNDSLGKRQTYPLKVAAGNTYTITYSWETTKR